MNAANYSGNTALHGAVVYEGPESSKLCKLLLKYKVTFMSHLRLYRVSHDVWRLLFKCTVQCNGRTQYAYQPKSNFLLKLLTCFNIKLHCKLPLYKTLRVLQIKVAQIIIAARSEISNTGLHFHS